MVKLKENANTVVNGDDDVERGDTEDCLHRKKSILKESHQSSHYKTFLKNCFY